MTTSQYANHVRSSDSQWCVCGDEEELLISEMDDMKATYNGTIFCAVKVAPHMILFELEKKESKSKPS